MLAVRSYVKYFGTFTDLSLLTQKTSFVDLFILWLWVRKWNNTDRCDNNCVLRIHLKWWVGNLFKERDWEMGSIEVWQQIPT